MQRNQICLLNMRLKSRIYRFYLYFLFNNDRINIINHINVQISILNKIHYNCIYKIKIAPF